MEKTKVENYLDDLGVRYQPIDSRKEDLENFEAVSSGEIGRSIKIARKDFETIVQPIYADLV